MLHENYFHCYKKKVQPRASDLFSCRPKLSVTRKCCIPKTTERWDRLSNLAGKTGPLQFGDTYTDFTCHYDLFRLTVQLKVGIHL